MAILGIRERVSELPWISSFDVGHGRAVTILDNPMTMFRPRWKRAPE